MKKRSIACLLAGVLAISLTACGQAKTDAQLEAEGWVKDPAANGWVLNPAENGWIEADKVDSVTTPTVADAITGASDKVDEALQLPQEEIRALALDYLRGWPLKTDEAGNTVYSYREMYQIATSHNNEPGLSSVEFVLDPTTMKLYASSEKGTEKCEHIKIGRAHV